MQCVRVVNFEFRILHMVWMIWYFCWPEVNLSSTTGCVDVITTKMAGSNWGIMCPVLLHESLKVILTWSSVQGIFGQVVIVKWRIYSHCNFRSSSYSDSVDVKTDLYEISEICLPKIAIIHFFSFFFTVRCFIIRDMSTRRKINHKRNAFLFQYTMEIMPIKCTLCMHHNRTCTTQLIFVLVYWRFFTHAMGGDSWCSFDCCHGFYIFPFSFSSPIALFVSFLNDIFVSLFCCLT